MTDYTSALEAILFASGSAVPIARMSLVMGIDEDKLISIADALSEMYERESRGIRLLRLGDSYQMCSAPEFYDYVEKTLEHRKPYSLTQPALEALSIIAYFQPVTRAYIEKIRGVDSSYTLSVLENNGLVEACGRLDAPGRPILYGTTNAFLRIMGISSLRELPELPDMSSNEGIDLLRRKIEELQNNGNEQLKIT